MSYFLGHRIGYVNATLPERTKSITYTILQVTNDSIRIDSRTGALYVNKELDADVLVSCLFVVCCFACCFTDFPLGDGSMAMFLRFYMYFKLLHYYIAQLHGQLFP